ncbi:MAG: dTMP kinase [Candidatus Puniceispirillaceae bacterium]
MTNELSHAGLFVSFEGGEGSGKSTQIKKIHQWLAHILPNHEIIITREPGGTPSAEEIRALLVTGASDKMTPKTEALLMLASRVEHVERLILPALARGAIVLCDRFVDSSFVYQSLTGGYDEAALRKLHEESIGHIRPHKTFLLDLPPEEGLARANARESQIEARFESRGLAYHKMVRDAYIRLAKAELTRFEIINACDSEDEIFALLQTHIQPMITYIAEQAK